MFWEGLPRSEPVTARNSLGAGGCALASDHQAIRHCAHLTTQAIKVDAEDVRAPVGSEPAAPTWLRSRPFRSRVQARVARLVYSQCNPGVY